ncbi:MAG: hypothetical protein RLZ64_785 [Pseudomonadota bacterium]
MTGINAKGIYPRGDEINSGREGRQVALNIKFRYRAGCCAQHAVISGTVLRLGRVVIKLHPFHTRASADLNPAARRLNRCATQGRQHRLKQQRQQQQTGEETSADSVKNHSGPNYNDLPALNPIARGPRPWRAKRSNPAAAQASRFHSDAF